MKFIHIAILINLATTALFAVRLPKTAVPTIELDQ